MRFSSVFSVVSMVKFTRYAAENNLAGRAAPCMGQSSRGPSVRRGMRIETPA
jgi:hypothetical protein